jgi:ankyrin repeat protein
LKNDRVRNSTPLHWASSKGHVDIIKLLLQVLRETQDIAPRIQ